MHPTVALVPALRWGAIHATMPTPMPSPTFVLGGYQTDFARNVTREGSDIAALIAEAALGACEDARVEPREIEVGHVGNFIGEVISGQGHLGGLLVEAHPAFAGMPCSRHEAACASGSIAILAAMADLASGRYDLAIVVGVELMRALPGVESQAKLGAAAWVPRETEGVPYPWASMFDRILEAYRARAEPGARSPAPSRANLSQLAESAFANAKKSDLAQTRSWSFKSDAFGESADNPIVTGAIRRHDCSQITDGAAAVVLASERFLERWRARSETRPARIAGWGHRTARMALEDKLRASAGAPYMFPEVRRTITDAYARAGIPGPEALDTFEAHDCFTPSAFLAIDHLGIAPPGQAARVLDEGTVFAGGKLPMNPSGGLIGGGHPVGATGVRMLRDALRQVTGTAGAAQVEGARRALTLNIGGSLTTSVAFVLERG